MWINGGSFRVGVEVLGAAYYIYDLVALIIP